MLHFSFSTVMMALLTSNLIVVLIAIPFLKKEFTPCFGYRFLFCFIILAFVRLLLPFEFPFTTNIYVPQAISRIIVFFGNPGPTTLELISLSGIFLRLSGLQGLQLSSFTLSEVIAGPGTISANLELTNPQTQNTGRS